MGSGFVIKVKIARQAFIQLDRVIIDVQVYMLVVDAAPEAFNEDIIDRSSLSAHTDLYVISFFQRASESRLCVFALSPLFTFSNPKLLMH